MRAKSVAYSLACSSGQPWPGERQQRRVLEKVAAAPTSSRAPVGSTEMGGGAPGRRPCWPAEEETAERGRELRQGKDSAAIT